MRRLPKNDTPVGTIFGKIALKDWYVLLGSFAMHFLERLSKIVELLN